MPHRNVQASSKIYLRFKRKDTTLFIMTEYSEDIKDLKNRLAALVDVPAVDINLFRYLTEEKKRMYLAKNKRQVKPPAAEGEGKKKKKSKEEEPVDDREEWEKPLDETKQVVDVGLENEGVVFYTFRLGGTKFPTEVACF